MPHAPLLCAPEQRPLCCSCSYQVAHSGLPWCSGQVSVECMAMHSDSMQAWNAPAQEHIDIVNVLDRHACCFQAPTHPPVCPRLCRGLCAWAGLSMMTWRTCSSHSSSTSILSTTKRTSRCTSIRQEDLSQQARPTETSAFGLRTYDVP